MTSLVATGAVLLLMTACIGSGGLILRALGILPELTTEDRFAWSFAVGFAALGWSLFFLAVFGMLAAETLFAVCAGASAMGVAFLRAGSGQMAVRPGPAIQYDAVTAVLLACTGVVIGFDLLEGLSPPAEADTLAYHFNLPKRYLQSGELLFVPRAIDGSPPQLIHMTYMAALQLGGERGLTLWTMASGWMTAVILYLLARRWLTVNWSLALALIYLSTPAILQTGGTGQVEPRLAQFVLVGTLACAIAVQRDCIRYAALAGICAGAFAAAKYTGLLFGLACFVVLLFRKNRVGKLSAFAAAGLILAFQWYLWSWINTGDPVFPMLYNLVGTSDPGLWTAAQDALFRAWVSDVETPIPTTPWWFVLYPFYATFINDPALENGRTGLGIFGFMILPFAVGHLRRTWPGDVRGPLFIAGIIIILMYALWFFGGAPQRVRHLVPIYPLAILCLTVPAVQWATRAGMHKPLQAGAALCILFQLGGQVIFGLNYARYVFSGETREAFLHRNVSMFGVVPWLNKALDRNSRVLVSNRQLLYLIDAPAEITHSTLQRALNFKVLHDRPKQLFDELQAAGITHLVDTGRLAGGRPGTPTPNREGVRRLFQARCLIEVHRNKSEKIASRTLGWKMEPTQQVFVFALSPGTCKL